MADGVIFLGIVGAFLIWLFFWLALYIFVSYVLWRVGRKFGVGSFLQFLIPIWDVALLCDCAKITRWVTVAVVAPGLILWPQAKIGVSVTPPFFSSAGAFVTYLGTAYIWGKIAGRFGKNQWLWGIFTPILFFIPVLFLAFGDSMPVDRSFSAGHGSSEKGGRYIDV